MILPALSTIVAILIIYGLLFAMTHRPWTAAAMLLYVLCFVLLLSVLKQSYLGVAATLADVVFFLLHPRENFHLFVHYPLLGVLLLLLLLGFTACLIAGLKLERPLHHKVRPSYRRSIRISAALASLTLATGAMWITSAATSAQARQSDISNAFESMYALQDINGVVNRLNAFFNNRSMEAVLPPMHVQHRFNIPPVATSTPFTGTRPDIFMILEESTFDPTQIANCDPRECDDGMLHPLDAATRTQQGPLMVHSTGGGTWLSEFAFMSGFDWRVFGRGGAYAPVSIAPRLKEALPAHLRMLGYRTVAIIPTTGNFLSAQTAYKDYGFDEFHSADDLKLDDDWTEVHDHTLFDDALKLVHDSNDPRPVFIFVLTIRNHGPHGDGAVDLPENFNQVKQQFGLGIADYLGRMRDSSDDFTQLAATWLNSSRPRVIGWFGDHQPEIAWDFTQSPERLLRDHIASNVKIKDAKYLTQYQFSANYGNHQQSLSHEAMDISYLGTQLLSFSGLPLTAGEQAALEVEQKCNGMMVICSDHDLINDYLSYRIHELHEVN